MSQKKIAAVFIAFLVITVGPVFLMSTMMMSCYQRKIDENPNSETCKSWQFTLAKWNANTFRPDLAAEMYKKFIDRYEKDPLRPEAMWRRHKALLDADRKQEAKDQLHVLCEAYPEDKFGKDADEVLKLQFNDYVRP